VARLIFKQKSPQQNKNDEFGTKIHLESLRQTLQQIDLIHTLIERHPSVLGFATSATEVWDVFRSGRIASLIGVEGLHQIANSASVLRMLFRLGVRYITLTHGSNNLYADSAVCWTEHTAFLAMNAEEMNADSFEDSSFSSTWRALGRGKRDFIRNEPNRNVSNTFVALWEATCIIVSILMPGDRIIDLSHTSDAVQKQALSLSRAPVIFSHSSWSVDSVSRSVSSGYLANNYDC
jgi:membrane dipeptidase